MATKTKKIVKTILIESREENNLQEQINEHLSSIDRKNFIDIKLSNTVISNEVFTSILIIYKGVK